MGGKIEMEGTVVPEAELSDGFWETGTVVDKGFAEDVEKEVKDGRVKAALTSMRDAVIAAADSAGGLKIGEKHGCLGCNTGFRITGLLADR